MAPEPGDHETTEEEARNEHQDLTTHPTVRERDAHLGLSRGCGLRELRVLKLLHGRRILLGTRARDIDIRGDIDASCLPVRVGCCGNPARSDRRRS